MLHMTVHGRQWSKMLTFLLNWTRLVLVACRHSLNFPDLVRIVDFLVAWCLNPFDRISMVSLAVVMFSFVTFSLSYVLRTNFITILSISSVRLFTMVSARAMAGSPPN